MPDALFDRIFIAVVAEYDRISSGLPRDNPIYARAALQTRPRLTNDAEIVNHQLETDAPSSYPGHDMRRLLSGVEIYWFRTAVRMVIADPRSLKAAMQRAFSGPPELPGLSDETASGNFNARHARAAQIAVDQLQRITHDQITNRVRALAAMPKDPLNSMPVYLAIAWFRNLARVRQIEHLVTWPDANRLEQAIGYIKSPQRTAEHPIVVAP